MNFFKYIKNKLFSQDATENSNFNSSDINQYLINETDVFDFDKTAEPIVKSQFDNTDISQVPSSVLKQFSAHPNTHSQQLLESRFININVASDKSTIVQLITLLGMIRYGLEKSGEGKEGENKTFKFTISLKNRNNSPLMIGIGEDAIPSIPINDEYFIGN